jgi:hypothetical protein
MKDTKMQVQHKRFLAVSCLLLVLTVIARGQRPISGPQWWYNFPSSPLTFQPSNADASYMDLNNLSGDAITTFRLGCINITADGVLVPAKLELRDLNLKQGAARFQSAFSYRANLDRCPATAKRLAVVEVHFSDGGAWTK